MPKSHMDKEDPVKEQPDEAAVGHGVPDPAFWGEMLSGETPLSDVYRLEPLLRVSMVREGVPAEVLPVVSKEMGMSREKLYVTLGIPRATATRKLQSGQRLSPDESERVLGILRLVGQAEAMVAESGRGDGFEAPRWVAGWLDLPVAALGGRRPGELMDTAEGRELVATLLARMQSGAYA